MWFATTTLSGFQSTDRHTIRANHSDTKRYAKSLYYVLCQQLGNRLPLIEFLYKNNYQLSIKMASYEHYMEENADRLYIGRSGKKATFGPDLTQDSVN